MVINILSPVCLEHHLESSPLYMFRKRNAHRYVVHTLVFDSPAIKVCGLARQQELSLYSFAGELI